MYAIARKFGVTVPALLAANPGINPNSVYPGQVLNVPGSGAPGPIPPGPSGGYTVQPGDTLFSIAVRFHTTTYALQIANHLANPNFIYPGQALIIPN
ncbi:MAG: LysM peptidoglycan-binding domain-containing protein [Chloroflexota bacterium]|nr:LysM peptidoglycan-binding domain-containing protein [Chloroflexota bacterium]